MRRSFFLKRIRSSRVLLLYLDDEASLNNQILVSINHDVPDVEHALAHSSVRLYEPEILQIDLMLQAIFQG